MSRRTAEVREALEARGAARCRKAGNNLRGGYLWVVVVRTSGAWCQVGTSLVVVRCLNGGSCRVERRSVAGLCCRRKPREGEAPCTSFLSALVGPPPEFCSRASH